MQPVKKKLRESINGRMSVFLFTGSKESALLISVVKDMDINIVFIDTSYHFDEIVSYVKSFGNKIEIFQNNSASANPAIDMDTCCIQRKAEVLEEYLKNINADCLIVPFRDEEKTNGVEDSYLKGIDNIEIIRPLADLIERDVWMYIKENKLSFSTIYNKGYKIVDCRCCTTRYHGRKRQVEVVETGLDKETEEKLKALGYM